MDNIIIGCGYAGAVTARILAGRGQRCHIIDKRNHIAGNMYDYKNEHGIFVHQYGPHISVMNSKDVYSFLSRFSEWVPYVHRVNAEIDGVQVPLPINFTGIDILFSQKSELIKNLLINEYGAGNNVTILCLLESSDSDVREFAEFIYEKVFLHYTMKMWGLKPDQIDPSVTARIPIRLSYDDRHFTHKYQVMPQDGFTELFNRMLDHPLITVQLDTNAKEALSISDDSIFFQGEHFGGTVYYTGALDELFDFQSGELPYRSLKFEIENHAADYVQSTSVLNWPDDRPATRRTEMKRLTSQNDIKSISTTLTEFPGAYKSADCFNEPYYPIIEAKYTKMHEAYLEKISRIPQLIPLGRLADYKYYNMEATIQRVFSVLNHKELI